VGRPRRRYFIAQQDVTDLPIGESAEAATRRAYLARRRELAPLPAAQSMTGMSEAQWQAMVVRAARALGWYVYHPHLSTYSERGWPDLSLLHLHRGAALFIEVKSDSGHLSEEQVFVIDRMLAAGLRVVVSRPADGLESVGRLLQT
jgi:hypothetical protein